MNWPNKSLALTRQKLMSLLGKTRETIICPVCDHHVKQYHRKFGKSYAKGLLWLCMEFRRSGGAWVHVKQAPHFKDFGKMIFWDMVEAKPNFDDPSKSDSGFWRPTPKGRAFCLPPYPRVPTHVDEYLNEFKGFSTTTLDIHEALAGDWFHFQELMDALKVGAE